MENTKLMRSAGVMDRLLKILQGFAVAGVIVCVIFIPLTAILGEKIIANASRLQFGVLDLTLAGDPAAWLDIPNIKTCIIVMLIGTILAAAAAWYCLRVLREILAPMKGGDPLRRGRRRQGAQAGVDGAHWRRRHRNRTHDLRDF